MYLSKNKKKQLIGIWKFRRKYRIYIYIFIYIKIITYIRKE